MPNPTWTKIARVEVTGGTGTLAFTSIPQTYQDLVLVANLRYSGTGGWADGGWTLNGSPSATGTYMGGTGGGDRGGVYPGQFTLIYNDGQSGTYPMNIAYFPNYTGSNIKCYWTSGSAGYSSSPAYNNEDAGVYASYTSAINSISINGTMVQSSNATLYGIKSS